MNEVQHEKIKITRIDRRAFLQIGESVLEIDDYSVSTSKGAPIRISVTFSLDANTVTEVTTTTP